MVGRTVKPRSKGTLRTAKPRKSATKALPKAGKKAKSPLNISKKTKPASLLMDPPIAERRDWRYQTLARMRELILEAEPAIIEERKWRKPSNPRGVPVWSHNGIVCTGETYKNVVKLTFARGANLPDPSRLFNSSLEGKTRRAIDIQEGETVDVAAFQSLVKAAAAQNVATKRR